MTDRLTIAIDIDDTISRSPAFFSFLSKAAVAAGHRVLIVTLREDRSGAEKELLDWGIEWHELFMASSEALDEHGLYEWKSKVCEEHGVDVIFDDMVEILDHVDDSVTRFLTHID